MAPVQAGHNSDDRCLDRNTLTNRKLERSLATLGFGLLVGGLTKRRWAPN